MAHTMPQQRQHGLTLFELVVFILVVSIIFAYAFNRFREYPAEAERANFLATTAQLKTGVNMQMMRAIARGNWHELGELAGSNPMNLMLEPPRNYVGSFALFDEETMPRRVWYFDEGDGELVYRPNDNENLYTWNGSGNRSRAGEIRFRIVMVHDGDVRRSAEPTRGPIDNLFVENEAFALASDPAAQSDAARGAWQGLRLEPVRPYDWESVNLRLP